MRDATCYPNEQSLKLPSLIKRFATSKVIEWDKSPNDILNLPKKRVLINNILSHDICMPDSDQRDISTPSFSFNNIVKAIPKVDATATFPLDTSVGIKKEEGY